MELSQLFEYQLQSTLDGFLWAIQQVPSERLSALPPTPLGEWSAAQHLFHMLEYEGELALPSMRQWLGAPPVVREEDRSEQIPPIHEMLARFEQIRHEEINLLPQFDQETWNSKRVTTFWGEVSLAWLVCKTYQHTLEHTHDLLRLALFWDRIIQRMARE